MNNTAKTILIYAGITLFIGGFVWLLATSGGANKEVVYSASALTAADASFDFQTISMKDGNVYHAFEVKNEGEEPVVIEKVYTSCSCTTASIEDSSGKMHGTFGMPGHDLPSRTKIEVGAGESVTVKAIYNPAAHGPSGVGLAQRSIYLETNSAKSPKLELSFQATVTR